MLIATCRCGPRRGFTAGGTAVADASQSLRLDPTGTLDLRTRFRGESDRRWSAMKRLVMEAVDRNDVMGLAGTASRMNLHAKSVVFMPMALPDKLGAFQRWIDEAMRQVVLGGDGSWTRGYIEDAHDRAVARAARLTGREVTIDDKVIDTMAALCVTELQGVMEAVSQQALRALADGHLSNRRPSQVARAIAAVVNSVGRKRSRDLANTIVVKTFSAATIEAFRAAGITKVGTQAERIKIVKGPHGKTLARDAAGDESDSAFVCDGIAIPVRGRMRTGDAARNIAQPKGAGGRFRAFTPKLSARQQAKIEKQQAALQALEEVEVLTAGDEDVCPICEDISDEGPYPIDEALSLIPAHPNAVLEGSTIASYGAMHEMVRARFSGPAIYLRTRTKALAIGPNHPMLTRRGFVKANELKEGDELLYDLRTEFPAVICSRSDFEQMPAVEDVFCAFAAAGNGTSVAASHLDLHGDAVFCETEIDVVWPARQLLPIFDPCGVEKFCEGALIWSDVGLLLESGLRSGAEFCRRYISATRRIMRGGDLAATLLFGHSSPFKALLLGRGANANAASFENAANDSSARFESFRQGEDGHACSVKPDHRLFRWDRVLEIHVREFSGLAFDASTETGMYNSDGYVVKNCRCAFVPASDERFARAE